ncbi:hypothetical protein Tco_0735953 [Tanacetum coccineum]
MPHLLRYNKREVTTRSEPCHATNIDGKDKDSELGVWELHLRLDSRLYLHIRKSRVLKVHILKLLKNAQVMPEEKILFVLQPGFYKQGYQRSGKRNSSRFLLRQ